ncbi:Homeodomain transcriptional factor [Mycena chlorophos]|uniref:Homeodomain transcriptional factor n=1 Tax=Mycena chlorophos TaxID=658473 RepID=A0A8H6T805_MYCCL|nr:Homeodomain transcriptional factor [Mycena chlorophos]
MPAPKPQRPRVVTAPRKPAPTMPPYIAPAYRWLLQHLYKPYPSAAAVTKILNEACAIAAASGDEMPTDVSIRTWIGKARGKIGWNDYLREVFRGSKPDMLRAARKQFKVVDRRGPVKNECDDSDDDKDLPPTVRNAFVSIEARAKDLYGDRLEPSLLVGFMGDAVKTWDPELDSKAQVEKIARKAYPTPEPSSPESSFSSPSLIRKRSSSELGDDDDYDEPISRKRSRNDTELPTPPDSARSSPAPTNRKRRLSESDSAPGPSKRMRTASAPLPTVDLATTPSFDFLNDWFLQQSQQSLDSVSVASFSPADFDVLTEEESPLGSPAASLSLLGGESMPNYSYQDPLKDLENLDFDLDSILNNFAYDKEPQAQLFEPSFTMSMGGMDSFIMPQHSFDIAKFPPDFGQYTTPTAAFA